MVAAVRGGTSRREVARQFGVSLLTVQHWVERAGAQRLDRVDWSNHLPGVREPPTRTVRSLEERILELRADLKQSALGEYGAGAIYRALQEEGRIPLPCERTIHRVLERRGTLDANHPSRRPPPPPGWYLPEVAGGGAELDQVDFVEGLLIKGGIEVEVQNLVSLHGSLIQSWPSAPSRAQAVRERLLAHWQEVGLPAYVQFDNDTRFAGPSNHQDVIGSVSRMCLSLGVVPVFVPPHELGFQAAIESLNGRWQQKVWARFEHESLSALQSRSAAYVAAWRKRHAQRIEAAPARQPFPLDWRLSKSVLQAPPRGRLILIRRTNDRGEVLLLGRSYPVEEHWPHRLVRCELDLDAGGMRFYALRRREPHHQPLLRELEYHLPRKTFRLADFE